MKTNKKLIAVITLLCFLLTLFPVAAFAEETTPTSPVTVNSAEKLEGQDLEAKAPAAVKGAVWVLSSTECDKEEHTHVDSCYTTPNVVACSHHLESLLLGHPEECATIDYNDACSKLSCTKSHKYEGWTRYHLEFKCTHTHTKDCYSIGCAFALKGEHTHSDQCFVYTWTLYADVNENGTPDKDEESYTIKYVNSDTVLQETTVLVGLDYPAYNGETPTKAADAQYTYTFSGWGTLPEKVTGDATHYAEFSKTTNKYTITWMNGNTELAKEDVEYGTMPNYTGETPTKASEGGKVFTFAGWDPDLEAVKGAATYVATFSEKATYTVEFTVEGASTTKYVVEGKAVEAYTPTKEYYNLDGWYKDENCEVKFDFTTPITENTELFAKWVPVNDVNEDGIADEEQVCTFSVVNDDVTIDVVGNALPGMEVTITATPASGKFIANELKVNGTVCTVDEFAGTKASFKYTLGAAGEYTLEFVTADATISLKSEFINWNALMTADEAVASIFENVNWGVMPNLEADTKVEYLEADYYIGKNWAEIGTTDTTALVGHVFGTKDTETIRFTFAGNDQIPGFTKEFTVSLADNRLESKVNLNNNVTFTYSENVTEAEMAKAIFDAAFVSATSADGTVVLDATYGENVFVKGAKLNAGEHTVTIEFYGNSKYGDSSAEVTVTVNKADSYVNVTESVSKYGTAVNASALIDTGSANRIEFAVGLGLGQNASADAGAVAYVNIPLKIDYSMFGDYAGTVEGLVNRYLGEYLDGTPMKVSELAGYLGKISSALESLDNAAEDLGNLGALFGQEFDLEIDTSAISALTKILNSVADFEGLGDFTIVVSMSDLTVTDAGAYLVGGVVTDANYKTSVGANYVVITPDGTKVELDFNYHDDNGFITQHAILDSEFDILGSHVVETATINGDVLTAAEKQLKNIYLAVDVNGEISLSNTPSAELGAYTQLAYIHDIGNEMFYAVPILRAYAVVNDVVTVEFLDANGNVDANNSFLFTYDGEAKSVNARAVDRSGKVLSNENLKLYYIGVDGSTEGYYSAAAPSKIGAYSVVATYVDKTNGYLGMGVAAMAIQPAENTFAIADNTVIYDGNAKFVNVVNEGNTDYIYAVVDKTNHTVNIVLTDEVTAALKDVKNQILTNEQLKELAAKLKEETASSKFSAELAIVGAWIDVLMNHVDTSYVFTFNGANPSAVGVYDVYALSYAATNMPVYDQATLTIYDFNIELDKATLGMGVDASATLNANVTVTPEGTAVELPEVTWTSSDAAIVSVDENGNLKANAAGVVTITATLPNGKSAECKVSVLGVDPAINVTGVTLDKTSVSLVEGNTDILTATVTPADAANKDVIWSSSDTSVATVDQDGKVTAVGKGTATITVTTKNGGYTASCEVTVTEKPAEPVAVTGVTLNKNEVSMKVGGTETLTATVSPENATNKNVIWTSSDETVATVDQNGKVTAVGKGTAIITAKTEDGNYTATCEVTVTKASSGGGGGGGGAAIVKPSTTTAKGDHEAFMGGYPDGSFGPDRQITRGEVAAVFARLMADKAVAGKVYSSNFNDVPSSLWSANSIGFMQELGVIKGYEDGTFRPEQPITRAEFVAMAARFEGLTGTGLAIFKDVPSTHWAANVIKAAAAKGWVGGYEDDTFRPDKNITRAEAATILCRVLNHNADISYIAVNATKLPHTFGDVTRAHWAYWNIMEATNSHAYSVTDGAERWTATAE